MKYLIMGRSGAGKDRLADELRHAGLIGVKSYTTRPRRSEDEDTHIFVTQDEADAMSDKVATTTIDGHDYFATYAQVNMADFYVIDPEGAMELADNMPDTIFHIVYVSALDSDRRMHAIARADDPANAKEVFESRNAAEDKRFSDFEEMLGQDNLASTPLPENVVALHVVGNDYQPDTMREWANKLATTLTATERLTRIIQAAPAEGVLKGDEEHVQVVIDDDGKPLVREVTPARLATIMMHDDAGFARFMREMLATCDLFDRVF